MSFFGVEINAQVNRLMLEIRLKLSQNKFCPNFRTIYRSMASFDPEITGCINLVNFEKALNSNGLFFKKYEIQVFEKAYCAEGGKVDWFTFMSHLREPMGPLRRQVIEEIFDYMDEQKEQKISVQKLMECFNPSQIESYKKKLKSFETLQNEMLSMFSLNDGCLTKEDFIAFYDDCSINFPHNSSFIRFVTELWTYSVGKFEEVRDEEVKGALKQFRFKLIQKTQGTQDEYLLRKLFEEHDRNNNNAIGTFELDLMLKKIGVPVAARIVEPMLIKLDKNLSGYIEFEEFKKFLFFDPYPI